MNNKNRDVYLIFGKTGAGKSTLSKEIIKQYSRVLIIDPMEEYDGIIFYDFDTLLFYHRKNLLQNFVYVCRFENDLDIEFAFKFCKTVGNILLVLEECSIYVSPQAKSSLFLDLVRFGRHNSISLLGISRRTTELHNDLKSNVDKIYSFKQTLPIDIKNMASLGFEGLENLISLSDEIQQTKNFRLPIENVHYKIIEQ